jgi:hypothetical protein
VRTSSALNISLFPLGALSPLTSAQHQRRLAMVERMCEGLKVELRDRVMALNILTPELDSLKVQES